MTRRFTKARVRAIYDNLQEGIAQHERYTQHSNGATVRDAARNALADLLGLMVPETAAEPDEGLVRAERRPLPGSL